MGNFACSIQHRFNVAMKELLPLPFLSAGGRAGLQTLQGAALPEGNVAARLCTPGHVCPCALPPKCICVHFNKKTLNTRAPSSQTNCPVACSLIYYLSLLRTYGSTFLGCWSPGLMTYDHMAESKE